MAWTPFNFFKYDESKDDFSNTTFNIKKALNDNWEHITTLITEIREAITNSEITVDAALSATSKNPVQNKVVKAALDEKMPKDGDKVLSTNDYTNDEKSKVGNLPEDTSGELKKKGNTQTTRFTNASVPASAWAEDSTYSDWPYKATITLSGVTATMECKSLCPDHTNIDLLYIFGPIVNTVAGGLEIWASEKPTAAIKFDLLSFEEVLG